MRTQYPIMRVGGVFKKKVEEIREKWPGLSMVDITDLIAKDLEDISFQINSKPKNKGGLGFFK